MIVCQCNNVTDEQILAVGSKDYYEVQRITKAGRTCGSCAPDVIGCIYSEGAAKVANRA